jgi:hypothetical protein
MLWLLLSIWTWPFFVLLAAFLVLEIILLERKDNPELATLCLILGMVALGLFTDVYTMHITLSEFLLLVIGYMVVGALYAIPFRYWIYVGDKCEAFIDERRQLKVRWDEDLEKGVKQEFESFDKMIRAEYNMPPLPWDHGVKGKVYTWWAYWPISAFWLMLHRPFEMLWRWGRDTMESISYATYRRYFPE